MADPFEVRMKFSSYLTHLSASSTSLTKTAYFALKHRDMDDDLHSCILETLEKGSMNNRANIMYFLEHHADVNMKDGGHKGYVEYLRRDIGRVVEAVAQSGANVKVCRRVVSGLGEKGVLGDGVVEDLEVVLRQKEEKWGGLLNGNDDEEMVDVAVVSEEKKKVNGAKIDKKAIEQRIEEDRERNKRLREGVWAVTGNDDEELDKMWDEGSDVNEDDWTIAEEEAQERQQFASYHRATIDT